MVDDPMEAFGQMAEELSDETVVAGRFPIQSESERNIFRDVDEKLGFSPSDHCLDIGCGPGNILIPLSFFVERCVGVDDPTVIERLKKRVPKEDIEVKSGNFLDISFDERFDKIIVYSVLHYLEDENEVVQFVDKAKGLLKPEGKLLIGDIPNIEKKNRFLETSFGKAFQEEWEKQMSDVDDIPTISDYYSESIDTVDFDDDLIFRLLNETRTGEFESYLRSQPHSLPFNHTREDILVHRRPDPSSASL